MCRDEEATADKSAHHSQSWLNTLGTRETAAIVAEALRYAQPDVCVTLDLNSQRVWLVESVGVIHKLERLPLARSQNGRAGKAKVPAVSTEDETRKESRSRSPPPPQCYTVPPRIRWPSFHPGVLQAT